MFGKRVVVLAVLVLFFMGAVSAANVVRVGNSIEVEDAVDLYAYEVNLEYTGSISDVIFSNFLSGTGKQTTNGFVADEGSLTVYESILESEASGEDGNGQLFDVDIDGDITLVSALLINSEGEEEFLDFTGGGEEPEPPEPEPEGDIVIEFSPLQIEEEIGFEERKVVELLVYNRGDSDFSLDVSTAGLGSSVEVQSSLFVPAGQSKTLDIVVIGSNRVVTGSILFEYKGDLVGSVPVLIESSSRGEFFDISVSILNLFGHVREGDNLRAQIDLISLTGGEDVPVTIYYSLSDYQGNQYLKDHESENFIINGRETVIREFAISNFAPGSYVFGVDVVYEQGFESVATKFNVEPSLGPDFARLTQTQIKYYSLIGGLILVIAIVVFLTARRKHSRR